MKNTGNASITLRLTASGWNLGAANGQITINWDREGISLNVEQSISATISLSVSPSISSITDFSVNLIVNGSGKPRRP